MSQLKVNSIVDASGGSNAQLYGVASPPNSMGFRNRILNGDCRIDQRNAGASVTPSNETATYITDRWFFIRSSSTSPTLQRSTDAPTGFTNSLLFTNASTGTTPTYAQVAQRIEGFNVADLGWGAAGAVTVTVSFWVKSSLTGTYSVALRNSASNRAYVSTYTISAANTWEQKTVTIAGDTTGTWLKDNGVGIELVYRFGGSGGTSSLNQWTATGDVYASGSVNVMGTANATWQITGVQLEAGTVASPFERRDYGRELIMCQRYFEVCNLQYTSYANGANNIYIPTPFKVNKRATPTMTNQGTSYGGLTVTSLTINATAPDFSDNFTNVLQAVAWMGTGSAGMTRYNSILTASAEL